MRPLLVASSLLLIAAAPPPPTKPAAPELDHFTTEIVDKAIDPCTDFFEYACGKWNRVNAIPADEASWGVNERLALWNDNAVRETLEKAATGGQRTAVEQKIGDYYASCMDETAIEKAGVAPLKPALDRIEALKDKKQLPELLAFLHQFVRPDDNGGSDTGYRGVVFGLYSWLDFEDARVNVPILDQSGMGMPGREFYLDEDAKTKEIRAKYLAHVARMLELSGEPKEQAQKDAQAVLAMETGFAKAAMDIVSRRDPTKQNHKLTLAQLQQLTPSFDWKRYLAAMKAPASAKYQVLWPDFFKGVDKLIAGESLERWRAYLRLATLDLTARFLSKPFADERFDFFRRTLRGIQQDLPRWRRCKDSADTDLGEAVGQAYAARYFPPEAKKKTVEIVKGVEKAMHQDIDEVAWMAPATKKLAHKKLDAEVDKIGYPDTWRDYSTVEVKRDDYFGNVVRAGLFETRRRLARFGKPADRKEWQMTPPTVNAYEDPQTNTLNFPAGILQPPFFELTAPDAVNFGATGATVGHELTHGFDDQGRKFDADGNLKDWWTAKDAAAYDERGSCIAEHYTQEVPEAGVKQDGKLSQGEDTADLGGLYLALIAFQDSLKQKNRTAESKLDNGLTEGQAFFLAYAYSWCGALRPEAARTAVVSQPHSLYRYRVNNVVADMPEFARAFSCKAGQKMVRAKPCRVW